MTLLCMENEGSGFCLQRNITMIVFWFSSFAFSCATMTMNLLVRRSFSLVSTRSCLSPLSIRPLSSSADTNSEKRRLDVAIVGAPNAGKSQLLNMLTQSNIAAVSRKRHTTRDGILGARTLDNTQIVFVDTPGFLRVSSAKQEGLMRDLSATAMSEMTDVDYTMVVIDAARKLTDDVKEALVNLMLKALRAGGRKERGEDGTQVRKPLQTNEEAFCIVLNKVDLVKPKSNLLELSEQVCSMAEECINYGDGSNEDKVELQVLAELFPTIFYVSALHNDGVDDIWNHLMKKATPTQEWLLPAGQVTQMSPVERVEEVLREKIYRCLHREVPHHVQQVNRTFQMISYGNSQQVLRIEQDLVVRTKSHQRLVMGKGGQTLQRIQQTAKVDLERIFECPVMLHLQVKWTKSKHSQKLESEGSRIEIR